MLPMAAPATGPLPGLKRWSSTDRQSNWSIASRARSSDRHVPPTAASVTTVWVSRDVFKKWVCIGLVTRVYHQHLVDPSANSLKTNTQQTLHRRTHTMHITKKNSRIILFVRKRARLNIYMWCSTFSTHRILGVISIHTKKWGEKKGWRAQQVGY